MNLSSKEIKKRFKETKFRKNRGKLTEEEEYRLLHQMRKHGEKWSLIGHYFPLRTKHNLQQNYLKLQKAGMCLEKETDSTQVSVEPETPPLPACSPEQIQQTTAPCALGSKEQLPQLPQSIHNSGVMNYESLPFGLKPQQFLSRLSSSSNIFQEFVTQIHFATLKKQEQELKQILQHLNFLISILANNCK